jgi:tRNA-Thr(GGU) m(6)t(6)A37 methyltransferase TsaA
MSQSAKTATGGNSQLIELKPVGIVKNQSREPTWGDDFGALNWQERALKMKEQQESVSELVIDADLEGILDGIDDFSHLKVLYWAHLVPLEKRSTTRVHPMGNGDFPLVGVFATHSPARPNSILATTVKLLERNGNILRVSGLDALDGSPILDIKPYIPAHEDAGNVRIPSWMQKIHDEFNDSQGS